MVFTPTRPRTRDVFLSFRGIDTREGFTERLYQKLRWHKFDVFKDDEEHEKGMPISEKLLTAIEESKTAIIVISPNFASSTWCLDELLKILECMEARKAVFPVFYDVVPSHVRHQLGTFAEAMEKHEQRIEKEKVQLWRDALTKLSNFVGWTSEDFSEAVLMEKIVEQVQNKVHPTITLLGSTEKLVGMASELNNFFRHLEPEADDVQFIWIWGKAGIGKTTLARLVYERISHNFQISCFLANVKEFYEEPVHLQNQLLSQILKEKFEVFDVHTGISMIKNTLHNNKVLLILDDVEHGEQLQIVAGKADWFGKGSRIIITTRDSSLLKYRGKHTMYEPSYRQQMEALQLFSRKAFHRDEPVEGYKELSDCFVNYYQGHPLALKILGSFLYDKDRDIWESTLVKLRRRFFLDIPYLLDLVYDGLNSTEKRVFLDVACLFRGEQKERVIKMLSSNFVGADAILNALVKKSFLTISNNNCVEMHDLIHELGTGIVDREGHYMPGECSRLWIVDDIRHVLQYNEGTEAIECILLNLPDDHDSAMMEDFLIPKAFSKMSNLRFLKIHNLRMSLPLISKYLPDSLRYFEWSCSFPSVDGNMVLERAEDWDWYDGME